MSKYSHVPPKASFIAKLDWESEGMATFGVLTVTMHNGKRYAYKGVPLPIYLDFVAADSAGRYFGQYVKGKFEVAEDEAAA